MKRAVGGLDVSRLDVVYRDVERRVAEHNGEGAADGARDTRGRRPVHLVYQEVFESRSAAQKREHEIKQLSKRDKLQLLKKSS